MARDLVAGAFPTTQWSMVLGARGHEASEANEALAELCQSYWYPIYVYIRRQGSGPDEAEDLTQGFFERFLGRNYLGDLTPGMGRFRSFLLASLKHYMANEWDRTQARKRGGGAVSFSIDEQEAESRYHFEPVDPMTPESLYERRWALTVLDRVLARLRGEFVGGEKAQHFDRLKVFLAADPPGGGYREVSHETGLKEGTIRVAVHRLRRRYGELLREEIGHTVSEPGEVEAEIRHLFAIWSTP